MKNDLVESTKSFVGTAIKVSSFYINNPIANTANFFPRVSSLSNLEILIKTILEDN